MRWAVTSPADNSDSELFEHLARIEEHMHSICEEGALHDPDEIMEQLQGEMEFVQSSILELTNDLERHPERFTNLNQLADIASRELLVSANFPIVVKTNIDPSIPSLRYADEAVLAAVLRSLQLCAEHAGAGCEILIKTSIEHGQAILRIEAQSNGALTEPTLPIKLRSISLTDLIHGIGGELTVNQSKDTLVLKLSLAVDQRIH